VIIVEGAFPEPDVIKVDDPVEPEEMIVVADEYGTAGTGGTSVRVENVLVLLELAVE
jgi:hypothetical protein